MLQQLQKWVNSKKTQNPQIKTQKIALPALIKQNKYKICQQQQPSVAFANFVQSSNVQLITLVTYLAFDCLLKLISVLPSSSKAGKGKLIGKFVITILYLLLTYFWFLRKDSIFHKVTECIFLHKVLPDYQKIKSVVLMSLKFLLLVLYIELEVQIWEDITSCSPVYLFFEGVKIGCLELTFHRFAHDLDFKMRALSVFASFVYLVLRFELPVQTVLVAFEISEIVSFLALTIVIVIIMTHGSNSKSTTFTQNNQPNSQFVMNASNEKLIQTNRINSLTSPCPVFEKLLLENIIAESKDGVLIVGHVDQNIRILYKNPAVINTIFETSDDREILKRLGTQFTLIEDKHFDNQHLQYKSLFQVTQKCNAMFIPQEDQSQIQQAQQKQEHVNIQHSQQLIFGQPLVDNEEHFLRAFLKYFSKRSIRSNQSLVSVEVMREKIVPELFNNLSSKVKNNLNDAQNNLNEAQNKAALQQESQIQQQQIQLPNQQNQNQNQQNQQSQSNQSKNVNQNANLSEFSQKHQIFYDLNIDFFQDQTKYGLICTITFVDRTYVKQFSHMNMLTTMLGEKQRNALGALRALVPQLSTAKQEKVVLAGALSQAKTAMYVMEQRNSSVVDIVNSHLDDFHLTYSSCELFAFLEDLVKQMSGKAVLRQNVFILLNYDVNIAQNIWVDELRLKYVLAGLLESVLTVAVAGTITLKVETDINYSLTSCINFSIVAPGIELGAKEIVKINQLLRCQLQVKEISQLQDLPENNIFAEDVLQEILHSNEIIKHMSPTNYINNRGIQFVQTIDNSLLMHFKIKNQDRLRNKDSIITQSQQLKVEPTLQQILISKFGEINKQQPKMQQESAFGYAYLLNTSKQNILKEESFQMMINQIGQNQTQLNNDELLQSISTMKQSDLPQTLLNLTCVTMFNNYATKKQCSCSDVLVVDDDDFSVTALTTFFQQFAMQVDVAITKQIALDQIKNRLMNSQCCPSYICIFIDTNLPYFQDCVSLAYDIHLLYSSIQNIQLQNNNIEIIQKNNMHQQMPMLVKCSANVYDTIENDIGNEAALFGRLLIKPVQTQKLLELVTLQFFDKAHAVMLEVHRQEQDELQQMIQQQNMLDQDEFSNEQYIY